MPKIRYEGHKFNDTSLLVIEQANRICEHYASQGYDLTLRQLYYQFVARGWLPNSQKSYQRLGQIISKARLAGMIDWDHIVDRTRNLRGLRHWNSPQEALNGLSEQYRHEKWKDQPNRVEVWIEKDALVGVLEVACQPMDVDYFSCRGYTSSSEVWGAAQRLRTYIESGQKAVILHLGDHDPSGVDMTRDIRERLWLFIATDLYQGRGKIKMTKSEAIEITDSHLEIRRIALNMDQVRQYDPPPNPAKPKDARYKKYVEQFGRECWELDALNPDTLVSLIQNEIRSCRDDAKWQAARDVEKKQKDFLKAVAKRWPDVTKFLNFKPKRKAS